MERAFIGKRLPCAWLPIDNIGARVFRAADFCSQAGELLPIGTFIGEERFVDFAKVVFAAAKGGLDFGGKRKVGGERRSWEGRGWRP